MKFSKNQKKAMEEIASGEVRSLADAFKVLLAAKFAKFDETVDAAFHLNVNPKHADQMVRGSVVLPKGTGRKVIVLVIAQGEKMQEAQDAGADVVGGKDILDKIKDGWMEFDSMVATPDMMAEVGKLGKVLGPRGMMPSPKTGTVTFNVKDAVRDLKAGKVDYKVDKAGNLHVVVGKASFAPEDLVANTEALVQAVINDRPAVLKGQYIKSFHLSTTMGPSVKIDVAAITNA